MHREASELRLNPVSTSVVADRIFSFVVFKLEKGANTSSFALGNPRSLT